MQVLSLDINNNYYSPKKQKKICFTESGSRVLNNFNGLDVLAALNISFIKNNRISFGGQEQKKSPVQDVQTAFLAIDDCRDKDNKLSPNLSDEYLEVLLNLVSKSVSVANSERPLKNSVSLIIEFLEKSPNKKQIELLEKLVFSLDTDGQLRYPPSQVKPLISIIGDNPEKLDIIENLANISFDNNVPILRPKDIKSLIKLNLNREQIAFLNSFNCDEFIHCFPSGTLVTLMNIATKIKELDLKLAKEKVDDQKNKCLKNSQLYINGLLNKESDAEIKHFFRYNQASLILFSAIFGKSMLNVLLGKRLEKTKNCLTTLLYLAPENIELLSQMSKTKNVFDKPFSENQKIEFIDLIRVYENLGLSTEVIKNMIAEGHIDLSKLQIDLTKGVLNNLGFTDEEISKISAEKLCCLDKTYVHLLCKENEEHHDIALKDFCQAIMLEENFMAYIHNEKNPYGKANKNTQVEFKNLGLNYEKWLQSSIEPTKFKVRDKNIELLSQIANQVANDMQGLYNNENLKMIMQKRFKNYIKDDVFNIPVNIQKNKQSLQNFIAKTLLENLKDVKERAKSNNYEGNNIQEIAQKTLILIEHLEQMVDDITKVDDSAEHFNSIDWTIKMWDRNNPNNIFQGNYSTCCIGMGESSGNDMAHYIMNTAFNMIELIDNNTGDIVGNALCYFVYKTDGQLALVLDNIEIKKANKLSDKLSIQLITKITEYASKVAKEVTGQDDCSIYMSTLHNDVSVQESVEELRNIRFLGDFDCDNIYTDLLGRLEKRVLKKRFLSKVLILKEKN